MKRKSIKLRNIIIKIIYRNSRRDGMNPIRLEWNNDGLCCVRFVITNGKNVMSRSLARRNSVFICHFQFYF